MSQAQDVFQDAKRALAETEDLIRNHEYFALLNTGNVSVDALRAFPGHQFHMWRNDVKSVAMMVQRFGDRPYGSFFNDDLQGELAARTGIVTMAAKLGMSEADLEAYEPTPNGFAFAAFLACLAANGSAAEAACGLTVNLAAWGFNCGQVSQALRAHYGFTTGETEFMDGFADLPSFDKIAIEVIEDDLGRGVAPRDIIRAARLIQGYEKMFWDAMASAAKGG